MKRGFWGAVFIIAFLLAAGSTAYIYLGLRDKATVTVPLSPVSEPEPSPQITPETPDISLSTTSTATSQTIVPQPEMVKEEPKKEPGEKTFTFVSDTAKSVGFVCDFNKWFRKPMKKEGKTWTITLTFKPGTYEYMFVVDGKRTRDPNNKTVSKSGRSVFTVK